MDGTASVNSSGRPHYASSIPVPRAASQTRIHTPAASPRLRPHQASLALSPQRAASPRLGKAGGPSRGSSPKASRGRGSPKASGAARESAEGAEGLACSPWSSPRATPKAALSSRAGSRSVGETQGTQGKKRVAQEGILTRQTRGRSPSRTSSPGETQVPGAPEGRKPSNHPGKDQRDVPYKSSGGPRSSEPDARAASGQRSPVCSPVRSARPPPTPGAISFSSVHQQSQPVTATVAPFRYRAQTDPEPGPLRQGSWAADGYSGPPSRTEESLSCMGKCSGGETSSGWGAPWARTLLTAHRGEVTSLRPPVVTPAPMRVMPLTHLGKQNVSLAKRTPRTRHGGLPRGQGHGRSQGPSLLWPRQVPSGGSLDGGTVRGE
eukprot:bmy_09419T0